MLFYRYSNNYVINLIDLINKCIIKFKKKKDVKK
jgi:hypothetical protein